MESSVSKITTVVALGAFSVLAALKLSDALITNGIVTDKNLAILLVFFVVFALSILITVAIYKAFSKSKNNEVTVKGSGNKTYQDVGNTDSKGSKSNKAIVEGDDNVTNQDKQNKI